MYFLPDSLELVKSDYVTEILITYSFSNQGEDWRLEAVSSPPHECGYWATLLSGLGMAPSDWVSNGSPAGAAGRGRRVLPVHVQEPASLQIGS